MGTAGLSFGSFLFAIAAAYFFYSGLTMPTTINPDGSGEIANLHLMQNQALVVSIAVGSAIVSAILAVGAAIVGAIKQEPEASA